MGLRKYVDSQYKAVSLLSKAGMEEVIQKLNAVEDQFAKVIKQTKIYKFNELEINTVPSSYKAN